MLATTTAVMPRDRTSPGASACHLVTSVQTTSTDTAAPPSAGPTGNARSGQPGPVTSAVRASARAPATPAKATAAAPPPEGGA